MAEFTGTFERKEVKYRLNTMQVRAIKQALSAHMAPDEYGQTSITSVYYDTPNRDMISRSLEKPAYKEKLRLRTYGPRNASAPVFVELKKKHEGIVYKRRIAASEPAAQLLMVGVPYENFSSSAGRRGVRSGFALGEKSANRGRDCGMRSSQRSCASFDGHSG